MPSDAEVVRTPLDRIADALETIAKPLNSENICAENADLRAKVEALAATLHVPGENIGAIFEDESLDLMGRHTALRKLGEQMVKLAERHQKPVEKPEFPE